MKKTVKASLLMMAAVLFTACGNKTESGSSVSNDAPATEAKADAQVNIRYIDEDSITLNYNLAKDFREASIRAYSKLESARNSRAQEIQRFGSQIEEKMRANGYLSEASYNADVNKFNKMQQDAQNVLASLEQTTQQELARQQQQLNDSIVSFINDYNKNKGYDAILFKSAGVYFNPSLDITKEVIEGLNARYNKVSDSH